MVKVLNELDNIDENTPEAEEFKKVLKDIKLFSAKADSTLDRLVNSENNWFVGTFMKMIK